jgi:hypothetical protein
MNDADRDSMVERLSILTQLDDQNYCNGHDTPRSILDEIDALSEALFGYIGTNIARS